MVVFSAIFSCFFPSSPARVSDNTGSQQVRAASMGKDKRNSKSSKGAPIVVSYFPVNSQFSRL
ncbi:hypothetical protein ACSBR2_017379 [Camellia fascicularis]